MNINCVKASKEETIKAIKDLRDGKTAGPGGIQADTINAIVNTSAKLLHILCVN